MKKFMSLALLCSLGMNVIASEFDSLKKYASLAVIPTVAALVKHLSQKNNVFNPRKANAWESQKDVNRKDGERYAASSRYKVLKLVHKISDAVLVGSGLTVANTLLTNNGNFGSLKDLAVDTALNVGLNEGSRLAASSVKKDNVAVRWLVVLFANKYGRAAYDLLKNKISAPAVSAPAATSVVKK